MHFYNNGTLKGTPSKPTQIQSLDGTQGDTGDVTQGNGENGDIFNK